MCLHAYDPVTGLVHVLLCVVRGGVALWVRCVDKLRAIYVALPYSRRALFLWLAAFIR